jgi:hypothetical protein
MVTGAVASIRQSAGDSFDSLLIYKLAGGQ